jgi:hypothetical protein
MLGVMTVLQILYLVGLAALVLVAFRLIRSELVWLGGSRIAYAIATAVIAAWFALSATSVVLAPGVPAWLGVTMGFVLIVSFALGIKTVVAVTGGMQPEAAVFYLFQRIYRHNQGEAGAPADARESAIVADALNRLEQWRNPTTTEFIDRVQNVNRAWLAGRPMAPEENDAETAKISELGFALWGAQWARRDNNGLGRR